MKYCVSGRQELKILQKADEIKIDMRDYQVIPEYAERFPKAALILVIDNEKPENFTWSFVEAFKDKLICCLKNLGDSRECSSRGIRFYYYYSVSSLFELDSLVKLGVCYVLLGTPLMCQLDIVKKRFAVPARAIANLAYEPYLIRQNGLIGGWIRPEDIEVYSEWIDVLEFYSGGDMKREAKLYEVYAEKGEWPGNLNILIENLNYNYDNRLIYDAENFAKRRATCHHRCLANGTCHYCEQQFHFVDDILLKFQAQKK